MCSLKCGFGVDRFAFHSIAAWRSDAGAKRTLWSLRSPRVCAKCPDASAERAARGGGAGSRERRRGEEKDLRLIQVGGLLMGRAMGELSEEARRKTVGGVFFDMDDTLVLTREADKLAHSAVLSLVEVRAPAVDRAAILRDFLQSFSAEAWDPEHKVDVTEWRARLWAKALESQGVLDMGLARDLQNCFDRERLGALRWASGVEALIKKVHFKGIRFGIITNGHPVVQRAKIDACKAVELFDIILVGGEEPKPKPHRDIFLKACHLAGCKAEESIMVGDTLNTDIQGGINSGFLATVWVNVHNEELPFGAPQPDYTITCISELEQVLEHLGVVLDGS